MDSDTPKSTSVSLFLEELYVARCTDTRETPSREEFMRFSSRLKDKVSGSFVNLRNQQLGISASTTLAKSLRPKQDLFKLDLSQNLIRDHGFQTVSHFVSLNKAIKVFNIGNNDLSDQSAPNFNSLILANHLRSLQIGNIDNSLHLNRFTSITVDAIADALLKTNSLQALSINGTKLDAKASSTAPVPEISLIKLIQGTKSLINLSMDNCHIPNDVFMNVIENGLCVNSSIQRLTISHNKFSPVIGARLAQYLLQKTKEIIVKQEEEGEEPEIEVVETDRYPHLFYLDASYNLFNAQTATAFANILTVYDYLAYLDLSFNDIGDEGALEFAKALPQNQTLVEIHLAGNNITSIGGIAIAKALIGHQTITHFDISKNKLGDDTAVAIANLLENNECLITLNVSTSMFSNKGGVKIAQATVKCPTLLYLDMSDNFFTEESGPSFEKVFRENGMLLKINVSGTQINHFSLKGLNEITDRNLMLLKQRQQKPLRNQYVKSQYSIVELHRKENILSELLDQKNELQLQIDQLKETIKTLKDEEESKSKDLSKQIQEKKQQIETEATQFAQKKEKLEEELKELNEKKDDLQLAIDHQNKQNAELRAKIDEKKKILKKMTDEFEENKAKKEEEVKNIMKAADELMNLAKDPEALAALEKLPEFLVFEEDAERQLTTTVPQPASTAASKKTKKSGKKRSKSPKK